MRVSSPHARMARLFSPLAKFLGGAISSFSQRRESRRSDPRNGPALERLDDRVVLTFSVDFSVGALSVLRDIDSDVAFNVVSGHVKIS